MAGRYAIAQTCHGTGAKPALFGFIDSLEAVDTATPGLEFLEGSHFWEAHPRVKPADAGEHEAAYRAAVGVDDNGASVSDAAKTEYPRRAP